MSCARLTCCLVMVMALGACRPAAKPSLESPASQGKPGTSSAGETFWVTGNRLRLKTEIFKGEKLGEHPVLVVVLHGDSPFRNPSYQYLFARSAASQMENVVVAALLRPGYADDVNDRSAGVRGLTTGDNYTPQDVDAIAQAIEQLKERFHPAATMLVGHSGGAAITGDIIGRWPSTVNAALLVSCPCVLGQWRWHMLKARKNPMWLMPVSSLSPRDLASKVAATTKVWLLVGSGDDVAPPELTEEYAKALRDHGVDARVTIAPNLPHDILLEPVAMEKLKEAVEAVRKEK